ncbi:hypothetical protein IAD21_03311 [Abditibacteriota bacterium]|nr:hypothetical protein IAD21_03311 [Abditibacteriota bacterium]
MFEFSSPGLLSQKIRLLSRKDFSYVLINRIGIKVFSRAIPHLILNEFPKSGGTWIGKMVARSVGLPFPRNTPFNPFIPSLLHCHLLETPSNATQLIVWRDPRDVIVSWYHHCFFSHGHTNEKFVAVNRAIPGYENPEAVTENLERFIADNFERNLFLKWSWNTFAASWINNERSVFCRYEDFLGDPAHELQRLTPLIGGSELSYERAAQIAGHFSIQSERARAAKSSPEAGGFIRQGKAGCWRDVMNEGAHSALLSHVGPFLSPLGYTESGEVLPLPKRHFSSIVTAN